MMAVLGSAELFMELISMISAVMNRIRCMQETSVRVQQDQ
jgi:hypothetical protein